MLQKFGFIGCAKELFYYTIKKIKEKFCDSLKTSLDQIIIDKKNEFFYLWFFFFNENDNCFNKRNDVKSL